VILAHTNSSQLQAYFLVADDMMDASVTRRGHPCWYRVVRTGFSIPVQCSPQPNVGNIAINDAFMLEAAIYHLLKKHFRQEAYYVDVLELFLEASCSGTGPRPCADRQTTFQTEMGQLIDLLTAPEDHVDLSKFSLEK
jgi:farnesyl diphosphate synthase